MRKKYKFIKNQFKSLRNSCKYIQPETIKYWEDQKNKEKWIVKNGFSFNIRKDFNKKLEIPNYVGRGQYSPKEYNYRDVKKDKFVGKSDFQYKKAHDCLF